MDVSLHMENKNTCVDYEQLVLENRIHCSDCFPKMAFSCSATLMMVEVTQFERYLFISITLRKCPDSHS